MSEPCCSSPGNDEVFTDTVARRTARRYRRRGLLRRERDLLDPVVAQGVDGATVFEIGGGVGQLQLALLDAGAAHAVNLELSPHYEEEAARLAADVGHDDEVERHLGDAATPPPGLPPADVVLLYRVVCCTDLWRQMLDTALARTPRVLGLTFPHGGWLPRTVAAVGNRVLGLVRRDGFTLRVHDPDALLGHLHAAGLRTVADRTRPFWRSVVLTA